MNDSDGVDHKAISKLQTAMGARFADTGQLAQALTHSSWSESDSERLEFLGDRVVGLVMAELLYKRFPKEPEGDLAKRHAALVCGETMAEIGRAIGLGDALILSESERAAGGADNDNLLADALEAVIGALYLDQGLDVCAHSVEKLWGERVTTLSRPPQDAKTALQEWAQARGLDVPAYDIVNREGPDHAPQFEIEARLSNGCNARASASNRRAAEKEAARRLLRRLERGGIADE
jgi:ribonuclease-3